MKQSSTPGKRPQHPPPAGTRRKTKYKLNIRRVVVCAALACLLLLGIGRGLASCLKAWGSAAASSMAGGVLPGSSGASAFVPSPVGPFDEEGIPHLINASHPLGETFAPQLADIGGGFSLQPRAAEAYRAMYGAAAASNIGLWVVSAYRSHQQQTENFNSRVAQHKAEGYSDEESRRLAARYIATPGTSEHEAGLALDLNSLNTSFAKTEEYAWLVANCANFGFILRYSEEAEAITQIAYEPWHFRYVGSNHAVAMQQMGITLEEYVALMQGSP